MEEEDAGAAEQRRADAKEHVAARGAVEGWSSSVGEGWPVAEGGVELVWEAALTLHLVPRRPSERPPSRCIWLCARGEAEQEAGAAGWRTEKENRVGERQTGWGTGDKKMSVWTRWLG
jgi:hypothetical protein